MIERACPCCGEVVRAEQPKIRPGAHRLLCGDSTRAEDVARVMAGEKAALVFTDPPYGVAFEAVRDSKEQRARRRIANDGTLDEAESVARAALAHSRNAEAHFVCCDWKSQGAMQAAMVANGITPKACIVWNKLRGVQNLDRYHKQHEFILYAGPYGGQPTTGGDVWDCPREFSEEHATPKPPTLIARALTTASLPGALVVDYFHGSGATMVAAEQTGRLCNAIEIDPRYVAVALERLSGMGLRPRLLK